MYMKPYIEAHLIPSLPLSLSLSLSLSLQAYTHKPDTKMLPIETSPAAEVSSESEQAPSAMEEVAGNDDLLIQILIHLPLTSLLRFKSVSKHWRSLIISPHFSRRRYTNHFTPSGLFLLPCISPGVISSSFPSVGKNMPKLEFIPLHNKNKNPNNPLQNHSSFFSDIKILHSCNGLLLYCLPDDRYCICNPTTKEFTELPHPCEGSDRMFVCALHLAFDPSKSSDYKVVCVCCIYLERHGAYSAHFQIQIYSPDTLNWRKSGELFQPSIGCDVEFENGAYWNGAINWGSRWGDSLYFNVEEERLGTMPMPEMQVIEDLFATPCAYLGESGGHLHLVEFIVSQFNVYEMKRDYSGWYVKYIVDLKEITRAFPEMIRDHLRPTDWYGYQFSILSIVRGEKDEDEDEDGDGDGESFMVLHVPGKLIRYNLVDNSFNKQCDVGPCPNAEGLEPEQYLRYYTCHSFQYIESLHRLRV